MKKIFTIFMSFVFVFCLSVVSFAAESHEPALADYTLSGSLVEGLPPMESKWSPERSYFTIFQLKDNDIYYVNYYKAYIENDNARHTLVLDGDNFTVATNGNCYLYKLEGDSWVYVNQLTTPYTFNSMKQFLYSDRDVKNSNGDVVFPLELSTYQILTAQVPNLVVKPIMTTLGLLVPLAIGLMALLILLIVLKKVFYQFQIK